MSGSILILLIIGIVFLTIGLAIWNSRTSAHGLAKHQDGSSKKLLVIKKNSEVKINYSLLNLILLVTVLVVLFIQNEKINDLESQMYDVENNLSDRIDEVITSIQNSCD